MKVLHTLLYRHQKPISLYRCVKGGLKGTFTILLLALIGVTSGMPLLMAPFGASCILLYTTPEDEFAQPINVIGGYLTTSLISIVLLEYLPEDWWTVGVILGISITAMAYLRITHPPAGAVPVLMFLTPEVENYWFLLFPDLVGSVLLVITATIIHKIPPKRQYPLPPPS